jgi:hypothetical protein
MSEICVVFHLKSKAIEFKDKKVAFLLYCTVSQCISRHVLYFTTNIQALSS